MRNWYRKLSVVLVVAIVMAFGASSSVGNALAQEGPQTPPRGALAGGGALVNALAELAGITPAEVLAQLNQGMTLSDVAAAQGLDPAAVVDQAVASLSERINQAVENNLLAPERAEAQLATLADDLAALMDVPLPAGGQIREQAVERIMNALREMGERGLIGALSDATSMTPQELLQQAHENELTTLAEIAAFNNLSLVDLLASAQADAAARIDEALQNGTITQEQSEALLARAEEFFASMADRPLPILTAPDRPAVDALRAVTQTVIELTGLDAQTVAQQVRDGKTLEEILAANGVSLDDAVAAAMAQVEAQTDDLLATAEQRIRDALSGGWQPRDPAEGRPGILDRLQERPGLTGRNAPVN